MAKTYFKGPFGACFVDSLMNLLVELDDLECAKQIPAKYKDSPLRLPDLSINPSLMTWAVRDFTSNKYSGILHANIVPDIESALRNMGYDDGKRDFENIVRIVREEIKNGNIVPHNGQIPANPPEIFLIEDPVFHPDLHVMVVRSDGKYVNKGLVLTKERMIELGYDPTPVGVLHVKLNL